MLSILVFSALFIEPQSLMGRVVAVTDGDTIVVLDSMNAQHRIRLSGIDAPEKKQSFGIKAKDALAEMVHKKDVLVRWTGRDKYGRIIGDVRIGEVAVNLQMVKLGMAWHYRQFSKSDDLQAAEDDARKGRRGLWVDEKPVAPWGWRRARRTAPGAATVDSM